MKIKYLIVGFVAGVLAAISFTAGANTVYEKYTAIARPDYTLVVDGQKVTLNTPPKTIDGVTHLPVREVATILDKNVNFDSKSGTITLTSKPESEGDKMENILVDEWVSLSELKKSHDVTEKTTMLEGESASSDSRLYIITIDGKKYEFVISKVVFGDPTFTNDDGIELKYINGQPHLKKSIF